MHENFEGMSFQFHIVCEYRFTPLWEISQLYSLGNAGIANKHHAKGVQANRHDKVLYEN